MANSFVSYTASGATDQFAVSFDYLLKTHVSITVDGVADTTFTWPDASTVQLSATPDADAVVLIQRTTPSDSLYVTFSDGTARPASLLNDAQKQALFITQERADRDGITLDVVDDAYDVGSRILKNVAAAVDNNDAANKSYVDGVMAVAGNVPTPGDPSDDDKALMADGGVGSWTSIVATHISDSGAGGRSLLAAANMAAVRALATPLTTNGDIWVYSGGVDTRLAVGTTGYTLRVVSGEPAWYEPDGWQKVETRVISGNPQYEEFGLLAEDYDYDFSLRDIVHSASATLIAHVGTGSSPYSYAASSNNYAAGGYNYGASSDFSAATYSNFSLTGTASTAILSGKALLLNPADSGTRTAMHSQAQATSATSQTLIGERTAEEANTAIRFGVSAGTMTSGTITMWKRRYQ